MLHELRNGHILTWGSCISPQAILASRACQSSSINVIPYLSRWKSNIFPIPALAFKYIRFVLSILFFLCNIFHHVSCHTMLQWEIFNPVVFLNSLLIKLVSDTDMKEDSNCIPQTLHTNHKMNYMNNDNFDNQQYFNHFTWG